MISHGLISLHVREYLPTTETPDHLTSALRWRRNSQPRCHTLLSNLASSGTRAGHANTFSRPGHFDSGPPQPRGETVTAHSTWRRVPGLSIVRHMSPRPSPPPPCRVNGMPTQATRRNSESRRTGLPPATSRASCQTAPQIEAAQDPKTCPTPPLRSWTPRALRAFLRRCRALWHPM